MPSFTMLGVPHVLVTIVSSPRCHQMSYMKLLRPAVEFPSPTNLEGLRIEDERSSRAVAVGRSQRTQKDAIGSTVDRVRCGVSRAPRNGLRLNHLHDLWPPWIGLRVENVNARRMNSRHDQVPPLHVRMRRVGAEAGTAGVPAKMVEFIPWVRHVRPSDHAAVVLRGGVDVQDANRVRASILPGIDERDIRERFRWCLRGHGR